ncbi:MAG: glycine cleavage system protein GcvH [Epulopiscium sp.]|nr:glycine cleavage system protein GcvH [Candidatus Epulonipiscium sp.]
MRIEQNLLYTEDHEWVRVEGEKAYIGITDFAQKAMGGIVFVDLPEVDDVLEAGDVLGAVESVKAASDIYAPIDGVVIEVNEELVDSPELVNNQPYESWLICVKITNLGDLEELLSAKAYEEFLQEEE